MTLTAATHQRIIGDAIKAANRDGCTVVSVNDPDLDLYDPDLGEALIRVEAAT